jgi:hypothetical protein
VSGCCRPPRGYETLFGERAARKDARRYRRKGLDDTAQRMVDFLRGRVKDASVLEIGGGVGAIQIELLRAGAAEAVNLELSPAYEASAGELACENGLEDRVERRLGDVVEEPELAGPADAVVMHRVVCCYPDADALVGAAAERARRALVLSFPRDRRLVRGGFALINLVARLLRWEFRGWVHPPVVIVAAAEARGLRPAFEHQGRIWQIAALERAPS